MPQNFRVGRHLAPAQKRQTFLFADDLKQLFGLVAAQLFLWEEEHTYAILALFTQGDAEFGGCFLKKCIADLRQDANTVAGLALGILTGAMFQMLYNLQRIINGFVGLAPLDIHDCTNAAVIMLKARVVQPGRGLTLGKVLHFLYTLLPSCNPGFCAHSFAGNRVKQKGAPTGHTSPGGNAFVLAATIPYYTTVYNTESEESYKIKFET